MSTSPLTDLLRETNPMPTERLTTPGIDEAARDLAAAIVATDLTTSAPRRRPRRHARLVLVTATAALLLAVTIPFAVLHLGKRGDDGTAWGAAQIRFANNSPLLLLQAPGWRVVYVDEYGTREGEFHTVRGPWSDVQPAPVDASANQPSNVNEVDLNWRPADQYNERLQQWIGDPYAAKDEAEFLGTTFTLIQMRDGTPGHRFFIALARYDGYALEFRTGAASMDAAKELLSHLEAVDADAWLSALPASAIQPQSQLTTVKDMLHGVPTPPGFDPAQVKVNGRALGETFTKDRYQLGAAVASNVACRWTALWVRARHDGDAKAAQQALDALGTSRSWPLLREMTRQGDYPEVLQETASALAAAGATGDKPVDRDVDSALGCGEQGIRLVAR